MGRCGRLLCAACSALWRRMPRRRLSRPPETENAAKAFDVAGPRLKQRNFEQRWRSATRGAVPRNTDHGFASDSSSKRIERSVGSSSVSSIWSSINWNRRRRKRQKDHKPHGPLDSEAQFGVEGPAAPTRGQVWKHPLASWRVWWPARWTHG